MNHARRSSKTELKQAIGRNALWSLAQTTVAALTVFVLYKYLYAFLGAEQLGLWAVILSSVSIGRLAELGFSTTVLRFVSKHLAAGDRERAGHILETGMVSIAIPLALLMLACYPLVRAAMQFVVPANSLHVAQDVLPLALATLWFGVTGSIAQSALDGCGRMDIKSRILVFGNLVYVPAAIFMVQLLGITGLALCQLLQAAIVGLLVWIATRRELPALQIVPARWNKSCFREIIGYAAGLQIGNLLIMLFEPATKILLSRYCGLSEVAHFEMANQVVSRVRSLITSAMQAYLPALSSVAADTKSSQKLIGEAMTFITGIGLPLMAGLVIAYPIISLLWIGYIQVDFVYYGWILGIGWLVATAAMPTYFYCVGAGRVGSILVSQVLMVLINGGLGFTAALFGLGRWVAISMMVSLAAGNMVTTIRALADLETGFGKLLQTEAARKATRSIVMTIAILVMHVAISLATSLDSFVYANFVLNAVLLLLVIFLSDARALLFARIRKGR